jgi:DNA-binding PadR family transcriptional regulator
MGRKKNITDLVEAQILGAYVIQSLGKATSPEAMTALDTGGGLSVLNVQITEERLVNALRALQSRGLVSINQELREGFEVKVSVYSLTRAAWTTTPEVATFTKLLPVLVQTADAEELKSLFDAEETKTRSSEKKKGRLPDIRDYICLEMDFETLEPLFSSVLSSSVSVGSRWCLQRRLPNRTARLRALARRSALGRGAVSSIQRRSCLASSF